MDMQTIQFYGQIVSAVIFGNALFGMVFYFFWQAEKLHKDGKPTSDLPFGTLFCGVFPWVIAVIGLYSIG